MPETEEEWKELSDQIFSTWQYPNSIGAMDGKHIGIFNPADSGSTFYNYKSFYSIVLFGTSQSSIPIHLRKDRVSRV